jgi:hypothetical protein
MVLGSNTMTLGNGVAFTVSNGHFVVFNNNLGVGKSNPAFKVDVDGIVNSSAFYVNGTPYIASQWQTDYTLSNSISITKCNVGINTLTPQSALHVAGDSNVLFAGRPAMRGLRVDKRYESSNYNNYMVDLGSNPLNIVPSQWTTNGNKVYIAGSNIGIGITTPTYPLDVNGIINATGGIYLNGQPFTSSRWRSNALSNIYVTGSNVGIGAANPTSPLHVAGMPGLTATYIYISQRPLI